MQESTKAPLPGKAFLSEIWIAWEREVIEAQNLGIRVVLLHIGAVLGQGVGALSRMLPPFRLGLDGGLGPGTQWFPCFHVDDVVSLARETLTNAALSGPVNVVARVRRPTPILLGPCAAQSMGLRSPW